MNILQCLMIIQDHQTPSGIHLTSLQPIKSISSLFYYQNTKNIKNMAANERKKIFLLIEKIQINIINDQSYAHLSYFKTSKLIVCFQQSLLHKIVLNFIVFIIQFYNSMRFGNNKQKLVLNRIRKPSEFEKLSIQTQPMIKLTNHQLPLGKKDLNILNRNNNSSIFRKQSYPKLQTNVKGNINALRCRSLSSMEYHRKQVDRTPVINEKNQLKLQLANSELQEDESTWGQEINDILSQISNNFKSRGILTLKNNRYWIDCEDFKQFTKCLAEKILSQKQKIQKQSKLRALTVSQASSNADTLKKNMLSINNLIVNLKQIILKPKKLSICSKVLHRNLMMETHAGHQQLEWKVIQDIQSHKVTPELLLHLAEKIKIFRIQSCIQELKLKELYLKQEEILRGISEKTANLDNFNKLIHQKQGFLQRVEKSAKDMESYLNSQPNKILQQEAQGYKKSEQQLFDFAFMLEQSSPESLQAFVEENILIPNQSFKFQLKSFPSQQLGQGQKYVIGQSQMEEFKCTIANIFISLIAKLKSLLERKHLKILKFVSIMRQLASYTIGKRQYLAEINKKMVIVSVKTQQNLEKLKKCSQNNRACKQAIAAIDHLRQMFELLKKTYYQAQLFY